MSTSEMAGNSQLPVALHHYCSHSYLLLCICDQTFLVFHEPMNYLHSFSGDLAWQENKSFPVELDDFEWKRDFHILMGLSLIPLTETRPVQELTFRKRYLNPLNAFTKMVSSLQYVRIVPFRKH